MLDASSHFLARAEVLVEAAERRAAIAGDEARRVEAGEPVPLPLHQQQAHDRLRAGDEDAILRKIVLVVERDVPERYAFHGHRPFLQLTPPCRYSPAYGFKSAMLT